MALYLNISLLLAHDIINFKKIKYCYIVGLHRLPPTSDSNGVLQWLKKKMSTWLNFSNHVAYFSLTFTLTFINLLIQYLIS